MLGKVWMLNVWASWCPPCLVEHPVVTDLAKSGAGRRAQLQGRARGRAALAQAQRRSLPASRCTTPPGASRIDYGVYGVPETYVIDRKGVIRYKHIGPLTPEVAQKKLLPLVQELRGG